MEGSVDVRGRGEYLRLLVSYFEFYRISVLLPTAFAVYIMSLVLYRLYFHRLAGFPGPKLAAATGWYEFYYDIVVGGAFIHEIDRIHREYGMASVLLVLHNANTHPTGPIVRITPHELVVNDAGFYNTVFVAGNTRRTERWDVFTGNSMVLTVSHELHRRRRKHMDPFFSRLGVSRIETLIIEEAKLLTKQLEALSGSGHVLEFEHVMGAYAGDIIAMLCSERSPEMISHPEFGKAWIGTIHGYTRQGLFAQHIPQLIQINSINHITAAKREMLSADKVSQNIRSSLFRYLVSSELPESERTTERLARDAIAIFGAGTVTTTGFFSVAMYYILSSPHIQDRLCEEVKDIMIDYPSTLPTWQELERLPYLHAIVKEGLRLSFGVVHRHVRVSPDSSLQYKEWVIPEGTPVGMSPYNLHLQPEVYPEPLNFLPDRWLGKYDPKMDRNWIAFSRGSRNCLGMNLAYAQIYWALAVLFRPGGPRLELFETDESDIFPMVDCVIPMPKLGGRGLRVKVV
ncbi:putative cytochrome P450 [Aspergillus californicus]